MRLSGFFFLVSGFAAMFAGVTFLGLLSGQAADAPDYLWKRWLGNLTLSAIVCIALLLLGLVSRYFESQSERRRRVSTSLRKAKAENAALSAEISRRNFVDFMEGRRSGYRVSRQ